MKKKDLNWFLNNFYQYYYLKNKKNIKLITFLKIIYGLNIYSVSQICFFIGFKYNLNLKLLNISDLINLYSFLNENFNFFLFELKLKNIKKIKSYKNYKSWRHIFNLPVRGQRSHTNAKTRKYFKII